MEDLYERDRGLSFGDLKMRKRGFDDGVETLLQGSVEHVQIGPEYVIIRKEGRTSDWYNKHTTEVPNACLLREMMVLLRPPNELS